MIGIKSVKIEGEDIYFFNSAIYLFESLSGRTLELDLIVSEVILNKYKARDSLIVEIELDDSRVISSFMFLKSVPGELPRLNLFCEVAPEDEYAGVLTVHENDLTFPNIEAGITLADIRKVEMPNEKISLKLTLPIDQVEWLRSKKAKDLNAIFKELLYGYLKDENE